MGFEPLECIKCSKLIPHSKKRAMVEEGYWKPTAEFNGNRGFHISALYSPAPNATWEKIVAEYLASKDDDEKYKTFINITLGLPYKEKGERPDWKTLKKRTDEHLSRYHMLTLPENAGYMVLCGVDVHKNNLTIVARAFGKEMISHLLYAGIIHGDTLEKDTWDALDEFLGRFFKHDSGVELGITMTAIDSGFRTNEVYKFVSQRPRCIAVKGHSTFDKPIISKPRKVNINWDGQVIKDGTDLWMIGDQGKRLIYQRLVKPPGKPLAYHFAIDTPESYYQELCNEKLVYRYNKKKFKVYEWAKLGPNHFFDCEQYLLAAGYVVGIDRIDWEAYNKQFFE
ncbi:MAG: hypothetical protein GY718_09200, partial [Lentisphaerae bacterium]|nr:hypothetical protein [Lentisphaerota bacterium]